MIPKEKGTEDPTKTRPITVSSVLVRFFNKIFAKRLEEQCPVSPRQKAFRRGDGIAENIHTLQSAIRHASQQKTRADPNKIYIARTSRARPAFKVVVSKAR